MKNLKFLLLTLNNSITQIKCYNFNIFQNSLPKQYTFVIKHFKFSKRMN